MGYGAPIGNQNAVGHRPPIGNQNCLGKQNALGHGRPNKYNPAAGHPTGPTTMNGDDDDIRKCPRCLNKVYKGKSAFKTFIADCLTRHQIHIGDIML